MLKRFLFVVVMALASCKSLALSHMPEENATPETTEAAETWMETEMNGVRLGVRMPHGWSAAQPPEGLMLTEYSYSAEGEDVELDVLVYLFVPSLDSFHLPDQESANAALAVLDQVVEMPSQIGHDALASDPVPFDWNGHAAAYYLLTSEHSAKTIVIAVEASDERLVVCNINMPASEARRVRDILPEVLDGLTINGEEMDGAALEALPDPLEFPEYTETPEVTPPVVQ